MRDPEEERNTLSLRSQTNPQITLQRTLPSPCPIPGNKKGRQEREGPGRQCQGDKDTQKGKN